jgi:serine/threonine protein kinase
MNDSEKWERLDELGSGGQGKVYLVSRINKGIETQTVKALINTTTQAADINMRLSHFKEYRKGLSDLLKDDDIKNHGALKILHKPDDARDANLAKDRIKREIEAMAKISHPNLLKIIEYDDNYEWFVSEYHPNGSLSKFQNRFKGDLLGAIKALKPIIEGVAKLHAEGYVHRDIKPQNIFCNKQNDLVLGDFGLIYFQDNEHTRISHSYENVGSRDWMPGWAYSLRIDEVRPAFDVFSLGKILWSMVSGKQLLVLWYYDNDENNLVKLFPKKPEMKYANELFKKCIVENENNCLTNAKSLLKEIEIIENSAQKVIYEKKLKEKSLNCVVCKIGKYISTTERDGNDIQESRKGTKRNSKFIFYKCNVCSNIQIFSIKDNGKLDNSKSFFDRS